MAEAENSMKDLLTGGYPGMQQVFLKAVADPPHFLDLFRMAPEAVDGAPNWLNQLLGEGHLQVEFNCDQETDHQLLHLYFSDRNRERIFGHRALGLAYPFLATNRAGRLHVLPLFIWRCLLEPHAKEVQTWTITHLPESEWFINPLLPDFLAANFGVDPARWERAFFDPEQKPDARSIPARLQFLAEQLGIGYTPADPVASPYPELRELDERATPGGLVFSALVGQWPRPLPAGDPSREGEDPKAASPAGPPRHSFGWLPLDPWQSSAMEQALSEPGMLVTGDPGTGKTRLLTHLLTNALSNGERCLVVSDRIPVLDNLMRELTALGLDPFSMLLRGNSQDLPILYGTLRSFLKPEPASKETPMEGTALLIEKLQKEKEKASRQHLALRQKIFGENDWTQTTGLFLAANRREGKALLASQLNPQDFRFSWSQFRLLGRAVADSEPLFRKVRTLNHPLGDLNAGIFVHQQRQEARAFIESLVWDFLERATALQLRFIEDQNDYGDRLADHYEQWYRQLRDGSMHLQEKIAEYIRRYGSDPLRSARTTLKFYGTFSGKFRRTLEAKEEIASLYRSLEEIYAHHQYFDHAFLAQADQGNALRIRENLGLFLERLEHWRQGLGEVIQEDLLRLSKKTVHPGLDFEARATGLEEALDSLVDAVNESGLYQLPLEARMLTLQKRQRFLEELMEKLEHTRLNMRDFDAFFEWQKAWFSMPAEARRIVSALVKTKPDDWQAAFESWFLHQVLVQAQDPALPMADPDLSAYLDALPALPSALRQQTLARCRERRETALRQARRSRRPAFERLFGKEEAPAAGAGPLPPEAVEALSEMIPLVLATPAAVAELLGNPAGIFHRVVVDEAQTIPAGSGTALRRLGLQVCLFAQDQPPGSEGPSLLDWAKEQKFRAQHLRHAYRYFPGNVLQWMNTPPERLNPAFFEAGAEFADGYFDEAKQTNEAEIRQVLSLLNRIRETPQRTLPSAGIVCFTEAQRTGILSALFRIKQQRLPGVERIQQLERNGLWVLCPEDLCGQHAEVLLVSTVYGPTGRQDVLPRPLGWIDQADALPKLLQVMSSARSQLTVVHSIPQRELTRFLTQASSPGTALLAAWLTFLKGNPQGSDEDKDLIRKTLEGLFPQTRPPGNALAEEIAWRLSTIIRTERIAFQVPFRDILLPLVIHPEQPDGAPLVILPDGLFAPTLFTDYAWEQTLREALSEAGYQLYPTWSVLWWKNPQQETMRLANVIRESDRGEATAEEE